MKRKILTIVTGLMICLLPSISHAGTVMIGVKTWYSMWDSAFGHILGNYYHQYMQDSGYPNTTTIDPGDGYLAGPMIGYQTDDKVWSFSMAAMLLGSFSQETEFVFNDASTATLEMDMSRKDIDLSGSYSFTDNFKVFIGYKYMYTKADLTVKFDDGSEADYDWYQSTSNIFTGGLGASFPVAEALIVGGQIGVLFVKSDMESESGTTYDVEDSWGYTAEATIGYLATENILIQAGVKYQTFSLKLKDVAYVDESEQDQFLGITLSAVYMW